MSDSDDFSKIYRNISEHVSSALNDISAVHISSQKGNQHLEEIQSKLTGLKEKFDQEMDYLSENAEWEKLTIAFFGETNAGKSTIIESLRVLFKDRERESVIDANRSNYEVLQEELARKTKFLVEALKSHYVAMENDALALHREVGTLATTVNQETRATKEAFAENSASMIRTLTACADELRVRVEGMGRALSGLTTAITAEQALVREEFARDIERLLEALKGRSESLDRDLSVLAIGIANIAGVAGEETETKRRTLRRRILLGGLMALAVGVILGGAMYALLNVVR